MNQPNRVRELRENRLMTQAQLADKSRVALRTIHSIESGKACRMDTARKILLALGLTFGDRDQVFGDRDQVFGRCVSCGSSHPLGQSCGCFDNHCQ